MLAVRLERNVLQKHDFVIAADLLEGPGQMHRRVFGIALEIFAPGAGDAARCIEQPFACRVVAGPADQRPDGLAQPRQGCRRPARIRPGHRPRDRHVRSLKLQLDITCDYRRLVANIRHGDNLPIAALGQRPQRPQPVAGSRPVVDLQPDAEMVGENLAAVEQASEQRVAAARDRMEGPGAIESVSEIRALRLARAASAVIDLETRNRLAGLR